MGTRGVNHRCCIAQCANGNGEPRMQIDVLAPEAAFAPPSGFSISEGLKKPGDIFSTGWREKRVDEGSGQAAPHGNATGAIAQPSNGIRRLVRLAHLSKLVRSPRVVAKAKVLKRKTLVSASRWLAKGPRLSFVSVLFKT